MLKSGRYLYRQVDSLPKIVNSICAVRHNRIVSQSERNVTESPCEQPTSELLENDLEIPPRIERGPTDILKALASTVGVDLTAFEYKYPDDPYFYPQTFLSQKIFALSLESGRKSAKWIVENNSDLFKLHLSDPPIQAFIPGSVESTESELIEKTLINEIEKRNVLKAIEVFKALQDKDIEVSNSTKQCLLELVCFYNCENVPEEELEKKFFSVTEYSKQEINSWKNKAFAEELFNKMDSSCPLANSALIQGMFKYNEIHKACELFNKTRVINMKLPVDAYNAYLSKIHIIEGGSTAHIIKDTLKKMSEENIAPNLGTLNAALESLLKSKRFRDKPNVALEILNDFENLGIKPSLGSFGLFFSIVGNSMKLLEKEYETVMQRIMSRIENEKHEILHPSDLNFFFFAMEAFCDLQSDLALQLNNMLWKNNNRKFIIRYIDFHLFFKKFFIFLFETKSIDFAMKMYKKYITYSVWDLKVLKAMLQAINENLASEYLPFLWGEIKRMNISSNRAIIRTFLYSVPFFNDESSLKIFYEGAINFLESTKMEELLHEDSQTVSCLLTAFVKNNDERRILQIVNALGTNLDLMNLKDTDIEAVFEYAVEKKNAALIQNFITLAIDVEHSNLDEMIKKALPLLDENKRALVEELFQEKKKRSKKRSRSINTSE